MARQYNAKESIQRIIAVSLALFKEKGFEKTSMQDIVTASGLSKGAIFHHFKSKEEIFDTAMEHEFALARKRFFELLSELDGHTAIEKIKVLLSANFTDMEMSAATYDLIAIESSTPHLVLVNMRRNMTEVAPIIADLIKEGIVDGSIQTDFPDEWAEAFILLYNHWCDMFLFPCDLPTFRRRLVFLQHLMRQAGCDIISDELIALNITMMKKILNEVTHA